MSTLQPSAEIEALTLIWQRVLRRSPIGTNDDFFDLGGDAFRASQIFGGIAERFGRHLPPATICKASTIASLAQAIAAPKAIGPLVPLKAGSEGPPVFVTHGIGSSVIDLVPLARHMKTIHPIYGMEGKGNDGRDEPFDRVEDMAQSFVDIVRKVQNKGPYFLIGYSLGGLVVLEMARQLSEGREEIGFLALLDSYPDRHALSIGQHARLIMQLARRRLRDRNSSRKHSQAETLDGWPGTAMRRVREAQYRALRNYQPHFYEGKVAFVRAAVPSYFPANPVPVWSPLVGKLSVETVPGDHLALLTSQVAALASVLTRYLEVAPLKA
jgi:acetoacetyl-CoA synthetase